MKSSLQKAVLLLSFLQSLDAQFLPESEARLVAWRAYGDFVGSMLTAGQPIIKGRDVVYVTPPNMAAVRGGTPVPESVTNYDLYNLVKGLQNQSEPLLDMQGPEYVKALSDYLQSVDLGTVDPTKAQLAKITQLMKFDEESNSANERYMNDARAQVQKQTFAAWINQRAPLYNQYLRQVQLANSNLQNYQISVYGPLHRGLGQLRDKIEFRAGNEYGLEPGYNMPVYPQSYTVQINPWSKQEQTDGVTWSPLYSLQGGFEESCDAWFNGTTPGTTRYSWNLKNVKGDDWNSLGHASTVKNIGGSGWFGLISAQRSGSSETTIFNNFTSKYTTAISLELTMQGSPLVFNIGAGYWDVPSIRNTYPTLLPGIKDNLGGKVQLQKLLIGYRVGLKITVADTGMWQSISKFVEDAKKNTGGGFSLWGFHFGAGGTTASHRESNSVKMDTMEEGGIITIPPSPPGVTFLLGALGKVQ